MIVGFERMSLLHTWLLSDIKFLKKKKINILSICIYFKYKMVGPEPGEGIHGWDWTEGKPGGPPSFIPIWDQADTVQSSRSACYFPPCTLSFTALPSWSFKDGTILSSFSSCRNWQQNWIFQLLKKAPQCGSGSNST